mgnify:CR=1 FL=1
MSRLITNAIRSTSATADAITMDGSGNVTFPANATCSGTATGFGGGKILQVVQSYSTAIYSTTSNSMTEYAAINTTLTPSSSSNKILIVVSLSVGASDTAGQGFQLYDGSTHISAATNTNVSNNSAMTVQIDSQYDTKQPAFQYLYSPNKTSATTIKVYAQADSGSTLYINRYGYGAFRGGGSSMTLMEVAA